MRIYVLGVCYFEWQQNLKDFTSLWCVLGETIGRYTDGFQKEMEKVLNMWM